MRQLMNAIVRANVIVNLRDRALVAGIVVRTLLQHLKPALGKGKPTQPWQSTSWQSGHQATERMYRTLEPVMIPVMSSRPTSTPFSCRGGRS